MGMDVVLGLEHLDNKVIAEFESDLLLKQKHLEEDLYLPLTKLDVVKKIKLISWESETHHQGKASFNKEITAIYKRCRILTIILNKLKTTPSPNTARYKREIATAESELNTFLKKLSHFAKVNAFKRDQNLFHFIKNSVSKSNEITFVFAGANHLSKRNILLPEIKEIEGVKIIIPHDIDVKNETVPSRDLWSYIIKTKQSLNEAKNTISELE